MTPFIKKSTGLRLALLFSASIGSFGCDGVDQCQDDATNGVAFDPTSHTAGALDEEDAARHWLRFPFPADHRRSDQGLVDYSDFPNPDKSPEIRSYTKHANAELDGFGTNAPIYLNFSAGLNTEDLPMSTQAFLEADAPIQLINITPTSSDFGQRTPLRWEYFTVDGKFVPPNTLAVAPAWGFPLEERTTYALILTNTLRDINGIPLGAPALFKYLIGASGHANCFSTQYNGDTLERLYDDYAPLREWLDTQNFRDDTLVGATVFTTQTITTELSSIYTHVKNELPSPVLDGDAYRSIGNDGGFHISLQRPIDSLGTEVDYYRMEGHFSSPNYQQGDVPYATEDGSLNIVEGSPDVVRMEDLHFVLTFPASPPGGDECYPIVQYSHGTTGSAASFASNTSSGGATGARLAARGMAAISIDQPLHGERWSGSGNAETLSLYSFNFFNPEAARSLFRQAAIDNFYLTRFIKEALRVPADKSPTGGDICFNTSHLSYFGHSQGGITGAIAAAFEKEIDTWVFSGTGGGLSITVVERKDSYIDVQKVMNLLLAPNPGEILSAQHPVVGLIQTLVEITDPINYAPYWHRRSKLRPPANIFMTSGEGDAATHHSSAAALAIASGTPPLAPVTMNVSGFEVAGLAALTPPQTGNTASGNTAGFIQWSGLAADHFLIFTLPEAIHTSMRFLESAHFEASPVLERNAVSTAR